MNGISRKTFVEMEQDSRLAVLYDFMQELHMQAEAHCEKLDDLSTKFERRKKFDTSISAGAGFVGGAVVMLFKGLFGK